MRAKRQPRHACEIERLEERQLLVAGIALTAGILSIEGTAQADQISMEGTNGGAGVLATIRSASNTILLQRSYEARLVSSYSVHGMGGDDTIRNLTGLIGTMYGDANNDRLIGGSGAETLYGGDGDDQLWSGAGADELYGGNGRDGLFGGAGQDRIQGGPGADRFLQTLRLEDYQPIGTNWWEVWKLPGFNLADTYVDVSSEDVTLRFRDTTEQATLTTYLGTAIYVGATWTDNDILTVDEAFATMVRRTGNNSLLRTLEGNELSFERHGVQVNPFPSGDRYLGWNAGAGRIHVTQDALASNSTLRSTIYHEVAHNFYGENTLTYTFRPLSGWKIYIPPERIYSNPFTANKPYIVDKYGSTEGFTVSLDKKWLYRNGTTFARNYGRTNPNEDFATVWEQYFRDYEADGIISPGTIGPKLAVLDSYFASLVRA